MIHLERPSHRGRARNGHLENVKHLDAKWIKVVLNWPGHELVKGAWMVRKLITFNISFHLILFLETLSAVADHQH